MARRRGREAVRRVGALYDIHGNLPALEAVLCDVARHDVDLILVGGDVVLGPMPCETLSTLQDLDIPVSYVRGNCDRNVVEQMRGAVTDKLPEQVRLRIDWVARQLDANDVQSMGTWPKTVSVAIAAQPVLFCHATPRNDNEIFTALTPGDRVLPALSDVDEPTIVCGHTHIQFDRKIGRHRVVNAGSVGMPFGKPG
ncbi:MAG TPA: metallophosphoesterase family protein, partial [Gemmatimonadaceae bacterium]|nr:metallophosphoesterase family protein [Gemmatimonadaceae bacterium]